MSHNEGQISPFINLQRANAMELDHENLAASYSFQVESMVEVAFWISDPPENHRYEHWLFCGLRCHPELSLTMNEKN